MNKTDKIIDSIYNNKSLLLRYFGVAVVCSFVRYLLDIVLNLPEDILSFLIWSVIFFPAVKLFAFKNRCPDVYRLMIQIMVYIFCIAVLWFSKQVFVGVLYGISHNISLSMSLGGAFNEVLCLILMIRVVFKKK